MLMIKNSLRILAGLEKPNLGGYNSPHDWNELLKYFKVSELYNYFEKQLNDELTVAVNIQNVDKIPKEARGTIIDLLTKRIKQIEKICILLMNLI